MKIRRLFNDSQNGFDEERRAVSRADEAFELIRELLETVLGDSQELEAAKADGALLPSLQLANMDAAIRSKRTSYRDGIILQVAYGLAGDGDLTRRGEGARTVAQRLGALLAQSHIKAVKDAYQNIAKNTPVLVRGNFQEFDDFLVWASDLEPGPERERLLRAALRYACASVAETARPVQPFPELHQARLTFAAVVNLVSSLFAEPSQGAHEQFTVAALLHALVEQAGTAGYRVETKTLNASDKSSRAAGDVQILAGGSRVVEAYEVTAGSWEEKLGGAGDVIRGHDLGRLHIVARVFDSKPVLERLLGLEHDVSVLEIDSFVSALVSALTRQKRYVALERLYQYLDRYQPDVNRVNRYVQLLREHQLAQT